MFQNRIVTVFGAYGHTGRFVVRELLKRGFTPILSGRDAAKLKDAVNAAPIVVEAAHRVVNGLAKKTGVVAAGEVFAAEDFLKSLSPSNLSFEMH